VELLAVASALSRYEPITGIPGETRRAVASRLISLGFDDIAGRWLLPEDESDPRVRLARATRALDRGEAATALAAVESLDAGGAAWIRAEALSASGEHSAAADAFARLGDPLRSEAETLRARGWLEQTQAASRDPAELLERAESLRLGLGALLERHEP
jgi:hypothetical protein